MTLSCGLPGYVRLLVLRFLTADDDIPTWETIARSLIIGAVSAPPVFLVPLEFLEGYQDYIN